MLLLLVAAAQAGRLADCGTTYGAADVLEAAEAAERYFTKMDAESFASTRAAMMMRLACIREPLTPTPIGAVHRVQALGAFLDGEDQHTIAALAGLLGAEPGYQVPVALIPVGHPVRALLPSAATRLRESDTAPLRAMEVGWIEVDGVSTAAAPRNRAVVLQEFDGEGQVVETAFFWPEDALGAWGATAGAPAGKAEAPKPAKEPRPAKEPPPLAEAAPLPKEPPAAHPWGLVGAAGASLLASGALYGVAMAAEGAFWDDEALTTVDQLTAQRTRTNALVGASGVALAAGVGLGAVVVVRW